MRRYYGGEVDGISRQLARYVHKTTETYMPEMNPMMVYSLDRFGRGGHHRPFNDLVSLVFASWKHMRIITGSTRI